MSKLHPSLLSNKISKLRLGKIVLGTIVFSTLNNTAQSGISKWVDDKGKVHYGDKPAMLNSAPTKSAQTSQTSAANNTKSVADQRRDNALLATYTTAVEIDLALARNSQIDEIGLQALQSKQKDLLTQQTQLNVQLRSYVQQNKALPPAIVTQQQQLQKSITDNQSQISAKQQTLADIKAHYTNDKQRFIELKSAK